MKRTIIIIAVLVLLGYALWTLINGSFGIAQPQATYVGIDRCKTCHAKESEAFYQRKFTKSWKILQMRQKTKDPECLRCHTTGYGEPTGFVSEEATPHLKYVQCEACHGGGSLHVSNPTNKEFQKTIEPWKYGNENVCLKCHTRMKHHREAVF